MMVAKSQMEKLNSRFDGIGRTECWSIVFFQSPSHGMVIKGGIADYSRKFKAVNAKTGMFIHDVPPLMFDSNYYLMSAYIDMYNLCDVVVVLLKDA